MGKVKASAPPLVPATTVPDDRPSTNVPQTPSSPSATPYQSATAEFLEAAAQGQTLYIRAVYRTMLHRVSLFVNALTIFSAIGLAVGQIWGMAIKNLVIMETGERSKMGYFKELTHFYSN